MPYEYQWKTKVGMVRILRKSDKLWYLYLSEHQWAGGFNFPDEAADLIGLGSYPLPYPPESGIYGFASDLGISDKLSDWLKVSPSKS